MLEQVISLLAALVVEILHPRNSFTAFKTIKFFCSILPGKMIGQRTSTSCSVKHVKWLANQSNIRLKS